MVKKFSFNDKLGHTAKVLSGEKTIIILPAPALIVTKCLYKIKKDRFVLMSMSGKKISSVRLPLSPGFEYAVCRPYREIFPQGRPEDYGYGWNDKRTVPVRELPDRFRVLSVDYKATANLSSEEWSAACMSEEALEYTFNYVPTYVYIIRIEMLK